MPETLIKLINGEVKMAQCERLKRESELNDEKRQKKKAVQPPGFLKAAGEGVTPILSYAAEPPIDEHAYQLADAQSDMQRAELAIKLQQHYGNRYVQRVVERYKDFAGPVQRVTSASGVSLTPSENNAGISVNLRTVVRSEGGAEEGEEQ
jgi:hypothetical protein